MWAPGGDRSNERCTALRTPCPPDTGNSTAREGARRSAAGRRPVRIVAGLSRREAVAASPPDSDLAGAEHCQGTYKSLPQSGAWTVGGAERGGAVGGERSLPYTSLHKLDATPVRRRWVREPRACGRAEFSLRVRGGAQGTRWTVIRSSSWTCGRVRVSPALLCAAARGRWSSRRYRSDRRLHEPVACWVCRGADEPHGRRSEPSVDRDHEFLGGGL